MDTPLMYEQAGNGEVGYSSILNSVHIGVGIYVLCMVCIVPCCVVGGSQDIVSRVPWQTPPGIILLGMPRSGVRHRLDRRDLTNKPGAAASTTNPTTNNSYIPTTTISTTTTSTAGSDGSLAASLNLARSGGDDDNTAHDQFLSRVTPSHWAPTDPLPTDSAIPSNTTIVVTITTESNSKLLSHEVDEYTNPIESAWSSGVTGFTAPTLQVSPTTELHFGDNGIGTSDSSYMNGSLEPVWLKEIGRPIIFPALLLLSWAFTSVALVLHILVPDLRANMGQIFMCYILSIWLKCILTPSSLFIMLCAPDFQNKEEVCIVIAFVSYMMSMAYRFWLNIMCFDIWRKVSHLVRLEHVRPVKLWYYHLWGWGMPAMLGLMALLIREFASDMIIKPGFYSQHSCWFDHTEGIHQFLYLNLPGGLLHIANIIFVVMTRKYCKQMQQTSIPNHRESNNSTQGRIHTTTNYINEFNLQFRILNLMVIIWVLWSVSIAIHWATQLLGKPLWYVRVIPGFLVSLQGVIIFFIFIFNKQKRHQVQRKFPFLKFNNCCRGNDQEMRQRQSSISETSSEIRNSERRKKISVISVASLTSLLSFRSSFSPSEEVEKHAPVREMSSISSASYISAEGGIVNLSFNSNKATVLPPIEDTQSLCQIEDGSEITLAPSNFNLQRSISCTSHQPNTVMDENPVIVPVLRTLNEQIESYVTHQHL